MSHEFKQLQLQLGYLLILGWNVNVKILNMAFKLILFNRDAYLLFRYFNKEQLTNKYKCFRLSFFKQNI